VRDSDVLMPILHGGGQQNGLRAGTENPAGVVGMSSALMALLASSRDFTAVERLRCQLESGMLSFYPDAFVLGASADRLPTTVNICLPNVDAEEFVDWMAAKRIAISAGSACSYGARKPSYVALAHGLSYDQAKSCIRLSLSIESTDKEVDLFLEAFSESLKFLASSGRLKWETA
jgi:cysteine desulfurase